MTNLRQNEESHFNNFEVQNYVDVHFDEAFLIHIRDLSPPDIRWNIVMNYPCRNRSSSLLVEGWLCLNNTSQTIPDSKVHGANMGPAGPNFAVWGTQFALFFILLWFCIDQFSPYIIGLCHLLDASELTWANVDPDLYHPMPLLGYNVLMSIKPSYNLHTLRFWIILYVSLNAGKHERGWYWCKIYGYSQSTSWNIRVIHENPTAWNLFSALLALDSH